MHTTAAIFTSLLTFGSVYASPLDILQPRDDVIQSTCGSNITAQLNWGNPVPSWQDTDHPSNAQWCMSRYDHGARIVGLAAFKGKTSDGGCEGKGGITRLEVRYSDGITNAIGSPNKDCEAGSLGLDDDMVFSKVISQPAGDDTETQGKMEFWFNKASTPDDITKKWLKDEYNPGQKSQEYDAKGGDLIGLVGYQRYDALLTVVPIFSPATIKEITRTNVYYDKGNLADIPKIPSSCGRKGFINNSTKIRKYTFTITDTTTTTYTTHWTHTRKGGTTQTIKLEEGWKIPFLSITKFGAEISGTWEVGVEDGAEDGKTKTTTITGTEEGEYDPHSFMDCQCTKITASGTFTVTSDVNLYYNDGSKWTYPAIDTISGQDMVGPNSISRCDQRPLQEGDFNAADVTIMNDGDTTQGDTPSDASNSQLLAWASYTNPLADPQAWNRLVGYDKGKLSILVANVLNGPDYKVDKNWADVIQRSAQSGKTVLGYVRTGYLGVSSQKFKTRLGSSDLADWVSQIEQDVDKWYELYPNMGGIFFDEGWPECGSSNMYSDVYAYINAYTKKKHSGAYTVLNPGSPMAQCFEDTMDTLLTFEASYDSYVNKFVPNDWIPKDDRKLWHIIYNVPQDKISEVTNLSRQRHAGYIELTDENATPNPYDKVPTDGYMQDLMSKVPGGFLQASKAKQVGGDAEYYQPGSPTDSQIAATDYTSVTLTWSPVAGAAGYVVYKDGTLVIQLPPSLTRARIGMMDPGTTAQFDVRTILTGGGQQGSPRTLSGSTQNLPAGGAISNVKVTKNGDGSAVYNADILVPYAFVRLFIAGPHETSNSSKGWPIPLAPSYPVQYGLVNYMVEGNDFYSGFYKYNGLWYEGSINNADWSWSPSGTAPQSQSGYTYTWNVPAGGTDAILDQFIVQGQGYAPIQNVSSGAVRVTPCKDSTFCYLKS